MRASLKASPARLRHSSPARRMAGLATVAFAMLLTAGCAVFHGHGSRTAYVDDAAVTARVKTALIKTPGVKASEIDVHTNDGVVTLDGVVDNEQMLRRAEKIARSTPGVASVHSTLQIATAETAADR